MGLSAIELVSNAQRRMSELVSIRDAEAYEQRDSARTAGAEPIFYIVLGCLPASLKALPAESLH